MRTIDRQDKVICAQCGSKNPENGFTPKRVIHQGRNPFTQKKEVLESVFTVCAGTQCGTHLQFAHEG